MATFITKGMNFARAYVRWVKAGNPLRSDEYIFQLYDDFCVQCPTKKFIQLSEGVGRCDECSCHILRASTADTKMNKLAWPTEGCPDGHWQADVDAKEKS